MDFFSAVVSAKQPFEQKIPAGCILNINNTALQDISKGRTSLLVTVADDDHTTTCTVCTLTDNCPHFATYVVVTGESTITLSVTGQGTISVCGTTEIDPDLLEDDVMEENEDGDDGDDEDED